MAQPLSGQRSRPQQGCRERGCRLLLYLRTVIGDESEVLLTSRPSLFPMVRYNTSWRGSALSRTFDGDEGNERDVHQHANGLQRNRAQEDVLVAYMVREIAAERSRSRPRRSVNRFERRPLGAMLLRHVVVQHRLGKCDRLWRGIERVRVGACGKSALSGYFGAGFGEC